MIGLRSLRSRSPAALFAQGRRGLATNASNWSLAPAASLPMTVQAAVAELKQGKERAFDQTIDCAIGLGLDPRKAAENLRGAIELPHGNGRKVKVAVFAEKEDAEAAMAAGAHVAGLESLIKAINEGEMDFTHCIATPGVMSDVKKVARILGPRNMMPNAKVGTITEDVTAGVKSILRGKTSFRVDKEGFVHVGVGKMSFPDDHLVENLQSVMVKLFEMRPASQKGTYLKVRCASGRVWTASPFANPPERSSFLNCSVSDPLFRCPLLPRIP